MRKATITYRTYSGGRCMCVHRFVRVRGRWMHLSST